MAFDPKKLEAARAALKGSGGSSGFDPAKLDAARAAINGNGTPTVRDVARAIPGAINSYKSSPVYKTSPIGMLESIKPLADKGFSYLGTIAKQDVLSHGGDPLTARITQGLISTAPDQLSLAMPANEAKVASSAATGLARRSLGAQKYLMKTPFARGQAALAGKVALEEGVIPFSGNPETMFQRANTLKNTSGFELGKLRESVGPQKIDEVFGSLEGLREKLTNGATGGKWDAVHKNIDDAVETLQGLLNRGDKVSLKDVATAKQRIKGSINYLADNAAQGDTKKIVAAVEEGLRKVFQNAGGDLKKYKELARNYQASKSMLTGLNNELSGQLGNMPASLPSLVVGSGQLATGQPMKAAATLGIVEGLKRRGAGAGARIINEIAKNGTGAGYYGSIIANAVRNAISSPRSNKKG